MTNLTPERRAELRELLDSTGYDSSEPLRDWMMGHLAGRTHAAMVDGAVNALPALLDAADERDRLAGALAATPVTRSAAAYGWDRAIASLQYEDGTSVEIVTQSNPFASRPTEEAHAYLPITEDADGLTCDICGAELADWAAADEHVDERHGGH